MTENVVKYNLNDTLHEVGGVLDTIKEMFYQECIKKGNRVEVIILDRKTFKDIIEASQLLIKIIVIASHEYSLIMIDHYEPVKILIVNSDKRIITLCTSIAEVRIIENLRLRWWEKAKESAIRLTDEESIDTFIQLIPDNNLYRKESKVYVYNSVDNTMYPIYGEGPPERDQMISKEEREHDIRIYGKPVKEYPALPKDTIPQVDQKVDQILKEEEENDRIHGQKIQRG